MRRSNFVLGALGVAGGVVAMAGAAEAHTGFAGTGFAAGLAHPFVGLDHLLVMVAVGLWAVQIADRSGRNAALWAVPGAFIVMMAAGAAAAIAGIEMPRGELGILGSLVVLGALVALAPRLPIWAGMALAGLFAVFHGHAHGLELPEAASAGLYAAGFVIATALLHGTGIALALILGRTNAAPALMRASGAAVAVAGVVLYLAG
jgi:urease accessory protein